jgi:hypothetical protein
MKSKHTAGASRSITRSTTLCLLAGLAASAAAIQPAFAQPGVTRNAEAKWPSAESLATPPAPSSSSELDALIEPLALYPDRIITAIFRASQNPLDVVRAARWLSANSTPDTQPDPSSQPWFATVADLISEPALIEAMDADIDRTQRIGELARTQPDLLWSAIDRRRAASGQLPVAQAPATQTQMAQAGSEPLASSKPPSLPLPTTYSFPEPIAAEPASVASFSNDAALGPDFGSSNDISAVLLPSSIATPVWATPVFVAPFAPRRSVWFVSGVNQHRNQPWCGWNDAWAFRWRSFYSQPSFALSVSIGSDPWRWSRWDCRPVSSWHRSSVVIVSRPSGHWNSGWSSGWSGGWSTWNDPFCEPAWDSGFSLSVSFNNSSRSGWGHGWGHGRGHGWGNSWNNSWNNKHRWNGYASNNWDHGDGQHDDHSDYSGGGDHEYDGQGRGERHPGQWAGDNQSERNGRSDFVGPTRGTRDENSRPQQQASNTNRGWPLLRAPGLAANSDSNQQPNRNTARGFEGSTRVMPPTESPNDSGQRSSSRAASRVASSSASESSRPAPGLMRVAERARRTAEPLPATIATPRAPQAQPAPRVVTTQASPNAPRPIPSIRPSDNIRRGATGAEQSSPPRREQRAVATQPRIEPRDQPRAQPRVETGPAPRPQPRATQPARNTPREAAPAPRSAYPVARAPQSRAPEPPPQARSESPRAASPQPAPAAQSQPAARKPIPSIRPRDNVRRGVK